jgi:hypothetical protein
MLWRSPPCAGGGNVLARIKENQAMFEVVLTYRPDFTEKALERFATAEEAQAAAQHISAAHHEHVIRVWVRQIREARTKP